MMALWLARTGNLLGEHRSTRQQPGKIIGCRQKVKTPEMSPVQLATNGKVDAGASAEKQVLRGASKR